MADQYNETYLLNSSESKTTIIDQQTIIEDIELTPSNTVELKISGITYDQNNNILSGVNVIVYDPDGKVVGATTSDTITGEYSISFQGTIDFNYKIVGAKAGYYDATATIQFTDYSVTENLVLPPDLGVKVIYGTVKDASGNALVGAHVTIKNGDTDIITVLTNKQGAFLAYDDFKETITYTVTATLVGYSTSTKNVTINQGNKYASTSLILTVQGANLTDICGRVICANSGEAIPDAIVGLFRVTGQTEQLMYTTYTNEFGEYSFCAVGAGVTYVIKASKAELLTP